MTRKYLKLEIKIQVSSISEQSGYISQELNYNFATICFMSRGLDNHQATKLRVCTLVVFSAGGRKQNR